MYSGGLVNCLLKDLSSAGKHPAHLFAHPPSFLVPLCSNLNVSLSCLYCLLNVSVVYRPFSVLQTLDCIAKILAATSGSQEVEI